MKRPFVFDMETSDPDDFLTLLLLLGHPDVDLVGVTVTLGKADIAGTVETRATMSSSFVPPKSTTPGSSRPGGPSSSG